MIDLSILVRYKQNHKLLNVLREILSLLRQYHFDFSRWPAKNKTICTSTSNFCSQLIIMILAYIQQGLSRIVCNLFFSLTLQSVNRGTGIVAMMILAGEWNKLLPLHKSMTKQLHLPTSSITNRLFHYLHVINTVLLLLFLWALQKILTHKKRLLL